MNISLRPYSTLKKDEFFSVTVSNFQDVEDAFLGIPQVVYDRVYITGAQQVTTDLESVSGCVANMISLADRFVRAFPVGVSSPRDIMVEVYIKPGFTLDTVSQEVSYIAF